MEISKNMEKEEVVVILVVEEERKFWLQLIYKDWLHCSNGDPKQ